MNIENLNDHMQTFKREVVDSGFKRDIEDYVNTLPSVESNIVGMREIAEKVHAGLNRFYQSDLPRCLTQLLPGSVHPFTDVDHASDLKTIIEDNQIPQAEFYSKLGQHLNQLKQQLDQNVAEIQRIHDFIQPYLTKEMTAVAEEGRAIISVVFKEEQTISSLHNLAKALHVWNRDLQLYHRLIKGASPEDIRVVEIQNGSIDLLINLNVDVALNFTEIVKIGVKGFLAYLAYKATNKEITESYRGHKGLLKLDEEKEKLLLENIAEAVKKTILEQHKEAKKNDPGIEKTTVDQKAERVTQLVTSHIVKGNEVKLIAMSELPDDAQKIQSVALREVSGRAAHELRSLPLQDKQKLLDHYGALPEEEETKVKVKK